MTGQAGAWFDRWWPRIRDVVCSALGGYLILTERAAEEPDTTFAVLGAMLLVVPAASLAQKWLRDRIEP